MRYRRLLLVLASLLISVSAVEVSLRVAAARAERAEWGFRIFEAERGWALRPGFGAWVRDENEVWLQINNDGMRDREHSLAKPQNTLRVAVLGDSYMQASNLPLELAFATVLEQRLDGCLGRAGRQAEVLNFGVSGYGTAQELLTYRHHASRYQPDIVVLAVYTGNDIFNNHRDLNESFTSDSPYFVLRGGQLVLDAPDAPEFEPMPWYQRIRTAVTDRLVIARRIWDGYALLRSPFVAPQLEEVWRPDIGATEPMRLLYQSLSPAVVDQAWAVTEALFLALAREAAAQGSELWIVTLSNAEQVTPDLAARRAFAEAMGVDSLFYPDRRIRDFARAHGIPAVSLAEPFADYAAANGVYLNGGYNEAYPKGTGHWNETAHRLAAGIVGDQMCSGSRALGNLR